MPSDIKKMPPANLLNEQKRSLTQKKARRLFAESQIGYSRTAQRDLWLWYVHHKESRGVGWRLISKNICADSGDDWDETFYRELENWGRGRGRISTEETFDTMWAYKNNVERKIRDEFLDKIDTETLVKITERYFSDCRLWNISASPESDHAFMDIVGYGIPFEGFWALEPERFLAFKGSAGEDSAIELIYSTKLPDTELYRVTKFLVWNGKIADVPKCGLLTPQTNNMAKMFLWDQEDFSCTIFDVNLHDDNLLDVHFSEKEQHNHVTRYRKCIHSGDGKKGILINNSFFNMNFNEIIKIIDGVQWKLVS